MRSLNCTALMSLERRFVLYWFCYQMCWLILYSTLSTYWKKFRTIFERSLIEYSLEILWFCGGTRDLIRLLKDYFFQKKINPELVPETVRSKSSSLKKQINNSKIEQKNNIEAFEPKWVNQNQIIGVNFFKYQVLIHFIS